MHDEGLTMKCYVILKFNAETQMTMDISILIIGFEFYCEHRSLSVLIIDYSMKSINFSS